MGGEIIIHLGIAFFLHRLLSGARNGMLYRPKEAAPYAAAVVGLSMTIVAVLLAVIANRAPGWSFLPDQARIISGVAVIVTAAFGLMALRYNQPNAGKYERDLHLWTQLEQMAVSVPLLLAGPLGLVALACMVYPSVLVQKSIINSFFGLSWHDNRTDDETGATYAIPSLGLKIPRLTQKIRAILAAVSIAALITLAKTYPIWQRFAPFL